MLHEFKNIVDSRTGKPISIDISYMTVEQQENFEWIGYEARKSAQETKRILENCHGR